MRANAASIRPAVLAYQAIPGLRLLPGGLALLAWAAIFLAVHHPPNRWLTLSLHIAAWGGAGACAAWYRTKYGRVRPRTSTMADWQMLVLLFGAVLSITYTQYLDRQWFPLAFSPLVIAVAALYFYFATKRFCPHYVALAVVFGGLTVSPLLLQSTPFRLFIDPGIFGNGLIGAAMVVSALLDDRVLRRLFPPVVEQACG